MGAERLVQFHYGHTEPATIGYLFINLSYEKVTMSRSVGDGGETVTKGVRCSHEGLNTWDRGLGSLECWSSNTRGLNTR
eukprot:8674536-Pyramimonas_sp.AAC.1